MTDNSAEILNAIHEIRDLLSLMAEPAIAERDKKLRKELRRIVGNGAAKMKAVLLMDGKHTQTAIHRETRVHKGNLSTLVKRLNEANLITGDKQKPKLAISILSNFFETTGASDEEG